MDASPAKPKTKKATLYFRGIDRELKNRFKSACYKRGSDMQSEVVKFMRKFILEKEPVS